MSTETKWTKGPLSVSRNGYIRAANGAEIALMCVCAKDGDADMLKSAWTLYEALMKLLARFEELRDNFESETGARYEQDSDLIDDANIALASARGEG